MDIEKMNELKEMSLLLVKFLEKNCNPNCKVEISEYGVKVIENTCFVPIK